PSRLVPDSMLEDSRLALEPASLCLLDVVRGGREDVEDEPAAGTEQVARGSEDAPAVLVRVHVQQRAKRADHERDAFRHRRLTQVTDAQVELDSGQRGPAGADVEHSARGVHSDDTDSVGGDRYGDPSRAHAELDAGTA